MPGPFHKSSFSSYDTTTTKFPNPNPKNFIVLKECTIGNYLILKIKYPDCTNYEGIKILVYENVTLDMLKKQGSIDPHFSDNKNFHSPIARFVPTDDGAAFAGAFVSALMLAEYEEQKLDNIDD